MACDEYFLGLADKGIIDCAVRFFTWSPVSISLGYYQKSKDFDMEKINSDNILLVRRITGGNAIFHKNDFTYSAILKMGIKGLDNKRDFYDFLANVLKKSLLSLNIDCKINDKISIAEKNPDCFYSPSQYEIVDKNGKKLVGSAQKISKNAMLQHGSFFYDYNPEIIKKYLKNENFKDKKSNDNPKLDLKEIKKAFFSAFKKEFELSDYKLTKEDESEIIKIANDKYSKDAWIFRK